MHGKCYNLYSMTEGKPTGADGKGQDSVPIEDVSNENPAETWLTDEEWVDDLNLTWRRVIELLMDRKPMYEAYADAYAIDITTPRGKNVAMACGSRLLRNANFRKLWDRVLQEVGFNDHMVDTILAQTITGKDVPYKDRNKAITIYNDLKGRVVKKTSLTDPDGNSIFGDNGLTITVVKAQPIDDKSDPERTPATDV